MSLTLWRATPQTAGQPITATALLATLKRCVRFRVANHPSGRHKSDGTRPKTTGKRRRRTIHRDMEDMGVPHNNLSPRGRARVDMRRRAWRQTSKGFLLLGHRRLSRQRRANFPRRPHGQINRRNRRRLCKATGAAPAG